MLKKKLGLEAIEKKLKGGAYEIGLFFKIPSTLTIPEECEKIGECAFWGCRNLKKVEIPGSVKSIGYSAFRVCYNLKEVIISEGCKSIGHNAFWCCERLESVVIPKSVEEMGFKSFFGCVRAEVIVERSESEFKEIGGDAFVFDKCKSVRYVKEKTRN